MKLFVTNQGKTADVKADEAADDKDKIPNSAPAAAAAPTAAVADADVGADKGDVKEPSPEGDDADKGQFNETCFKWFST